MFLKSSDKLVIALVLLGQGQVFDPVGAGTSFGSCWGRDMFLIRLGQGQVLDPVGAGTSF